MRTIAPARAPQALRPSAPALLAALLALPLGPPGGAAGEEAAPRAPPTRRTEALATIQDVVTAAGNAATDARRLEILERLQDHPATNREIRSQEARLAAFVERWLDARELAFFGGQVSRRRDFDLGIPQSSPLHPLTFLYRGRMLAWYALESGGVWNDPERRRAFLDQARGLFERAATTFPREPIARMYLGEPRPAPRRYATVSGAPAWAAHLREGLERLTDIIEWWVDHRQAADGQYGGGWGDDCEMWRWWIPVLIGFEDSKVSAAQARFSTALLEQPHMRRGYTTRMSDVEHTAEESADAITPMMYLDPESPAWSRRALRLAELMETLWTGRNERGLLQFKSTYFTAEEVDTTPQRACDTVYHARAVQPALLYWQRTGDERLGRLFCSWLDTWVEAAARAERGKPEGILPTAIHWPDGRPGGLGAEWWDPRNHGEHTLYRFPSALGLMANTLLLAYHMTGEHRYLEPLRTMAAARLELLEHPPPEPPVPGTRLWCAERLGCLSGVAAKYRFLTGRRDFDALLTREQHPYVRFRLEGDREALERALERNAAALRVNFEGYTSEVRYTDRVLRFPALLEEGGLFPAGITGIGSPDPQLLYCAVTGDPGDAGYLPANAVRWLTRPRDIAALVTDATRDIFRAELFHFGTEPRPMAAELYLLAPGTYRLSLTLAAGGSPLAGMPVTFRAGGRRTRLDFVLPPRELVLLGVEPATPR